MNYSYYSSFEKQISAEYAAFRDRVVADAGTIASADAAQNALDFLAANPGLNMTRYLDTRFGIRATANADYARWYSVLGADKTVERTIYGAVALFPSDTPEVQAWGGGAFFAGVTPALARAANYTWGMKYKQVEHNSTGYFWGNRYGQTTAESGWTYVTADFWRNYYEGTDRTISIVSAIGSTDWLWCVKTGPIITLYNGAGVTIGSVNDVPPFAPQELGIGGGTLSDGVSPTSFRYERFLTAATALTSAQRAAIQSL